MNILSNIKAAHTKARQAKGDLSTGLFLGTLRAEVEKAGSYTTGGTIEVSDEDAIKVIKKFVINARECLPFLSDPVKKDATEKEIALYETFLPKQLTEQDMKNIIMSMPTEQWTVPIIMKLFKEKYAGQYDGRLLSTIAKEAQK